MYPAAPPHEFPSTAEERLFHLFEQQLDDDYVVMHSVEWMMPDTQRHHQQGEIDFLVIHPKIGIVILEVKGGRIGLRDGAWYSIDRNDVEHALPHSPISQAQRGMRTLLKRIGTVPATRPFASQYRIQTGVVFPSITVGKDGLGPDTPRELIIDSTDLYDLESAIIRLAGTKKPSEHLGSEAMRALVNLLKPVVRVEKLGYAASLRRSAAEIDRLTDQQYDTLLNLRHHRQLAIAGCAGSGKTMLAMKRARFLAQNEQCVLLTCFNRPLAEWMQEVMNSDSEVPGEFIRVDTFDNLATSLLRESGISFPARPRNGPANDYYSETLPTALSDAIDSGQVTARFDAIIVDEGQDFSDLRWLCLQQLLADPEHSLFYVFFDSEQGIYEQSNNIPVRVSDIALTRNCRNTEPIHNQLISYYPSSDRPLSSGIDGLAPEIIPVEPAQRTRALGSIFNRIFNEEGVPTSEAVVLTFARQDRSALEQDQRIGKFLLTWERPQWPTQVQVSTVQRFKGLDRAIVILVMEIDHIQSEHWDRLLYVGISRARQHLIVLGELPEPQHGYDTPELVVEEPEGEDIEVLPEPNPAPGGEAEITPDPEAEQTDHPPASPHESVEEPNPSPEPVPARIEPSQAYESADQPAQVVAPIPQKLASPTRVSSGLEVAPRSDNERLLAAACYLIWFVMPVIVLLRDGSSPFARRHAWQSVLFSVASGGYFFMFLLFWAVTIEISIALACVTFVGWLVPPAIACYYAFRVYTRAQSNFLILTDLVRTLFRGV